jgi:phosphoglycolate phosphatase
MKIPLFDIDWTLIEGGHTAHDSAHDYAMRTVYGVPNASKKEIDPNGMTDAQIILEVLKLHGIPANVVKGKIKQAVAAMNDYFSRHDKEGKYELMLGVFDLLTNLRNRGFTLGLLTGNVGPIGWRKLELAGIKEFFSFGAFGDMEFKRVKLIDVAMQQYESVLHQPCPRSQLVIVGDAPLDVACAKEGGIQVVAVAAGKYNKQQLRSTWKEPPDLLVKSLTEKNRIVEFLNR